MDAPSGKVSHVTEPRCLATGSGWVNCCFRIEIKCCKPCSRHLIQLSQALSSQWKPALQGSPEAGKCQRNSCLLYKHPKCNVFYTVEVMAGHSGYFQFSLGHFCSAAQTVTSISCSVCTEAALFFTDSFPHPVCSLLLCLAFFSPVSFSLFPLSIFYVYLFLFFPLLPEYKMGGVAPGYLS